MAERYNPFMTLEAKRRMAQIPPEFLAQLTPSQREQFLAANSLQRFDGTVAPRAQQMRQRVPSLTDRMRMGAVDAFGANTTNSRAFDSLVDLSPLAAVDMLSDAKMQYDAGNYLSSAGNTVLAAASVPFGGGKTLPIIQKTSKDLYEFSQQPSKKLKSLSKDHEARVLRAEITKKRDERAKNRYPDNPGAYFGSDVNWRLKRLKEQNAIKARQDAVDSSPNAKYWNKTDSEKIKNEYRHGLFDGSPGFYRKKANLKGLVKGLKNDGWSVSHTSKHDGLVSSYYLDKEGRSIRISDHELPNTEQRQFNRSQGFGQNWNKQVIVDSKTSIEDILDSIRMDQ